MSDTWPRALLELVLAVVLAVLAVLDIEAVVVFVALYIYEYGTKPLSICAAKTTLPFTAFEKSVRRMLGACCAKNVEQLYASSKILQQHKNAWANGNYFSDGKRHSVNPRTTEHCLSAECHQNPEQKHQ